MIQHKRTQRQTGLDVNNSVEGETMEMKMRRILNNKEPITDGAPMIYTERKDGVLAGYNIRTDRFEVAAELTEKNAKSVAARRQNRAEMSIVKDEKDGGAESIQATEN